MGKARFVAIRMIQTVFLLWLVSTFLFFLFRAMPGDPASLMIHQGASPETVATLRAKWGLDDPLHVQYFRYVSNMLALDPGTSTHYQGESVWAIAKKPIFNSFVLVAPAVTFSYVLGSILGGILGSNPNSRLDELGLPAFIVVGTSPTFFTSIVLIIIFASWLNWLPSFGMVSTSTAELYNTTDRFWLGLYATEDFLLHYLLPFTAVVFKITYLPTLIMRTGVSEVRQQDHFFYNRMVGLPKTNRLKHLIKHASLPVLTLYPISLAQALGGIVIIELVFNWPGVGNMFVNSILTRDYPLAQFLFLVMASFIIVGNFAVDVVYGLIDPRISLGD